MCSYQREERFKKFKEVPDPYWSDDERGFNQVLLLFVSLLNEGFHKINALLGGANSRTWHLE